MMDIAREPPAAAQAEDEADAAAAQLQALQDRLTEAKNGITRGHRTRRFWFAMSGLIVCTCVFAAVLAFTGLLPSISIKLAHFVEVELRRSDVVAFAALGFLSSFFFLAVGFISSDHSLKLDAQELEDEIDLRQMGSASLEQKAHKLLRIQQHRLSRYLELILQQSRGIFVVGIGAMLVGVLVVIFTIWETGRTESGFTGWEKAIVASVGAIGAIMTNYVAAIYLKMFSDIGLAVQKSVGALSQSTNLNFANVLIANITSEEARNETLKDVAVAIGKPSQS